MESFELFGLIDWIFGGIENISGPLEILRVLFVLLLVVGFIALCVWMVQLIWKVIVGIFGMIFYGY